MRTGAWLKIKHRHAEYRPVIGWSSGGERDLDIRHPLAADRNVDAAATRSTPSGSSHSPTSTS